MTGNDLNLFTSSNDHDIETEFEFVSMLTGMSEYVPDVMELVSPADFYFQIAADTYAYMLSQYQSQGKYIIEEVLSWLNDKGSGEDVAQIKISIKNVITFNLDGLTARARLIRKYSMLRAAQKAVQNILTADKDCILEEAENTLQSLSALTMQAASADLVPVSEDLIAYANQKYSGRNEDVIYTRWEKLDRNLRMCRSDVVIIAARPSVGKTAFCLNLAAKFCFQGYRTALFSLEMSKRQVYDRLHACIGQVPLSVLVNNALTPESEYSDKFGQATGKLFTKPLYVEANSFETVQEIKRKCRKNKSDVIIIDYLQLLTPSLNKKNAGRAEEVSDMTRQLKIMAGELNALVIVLSQLNRSVESRAIPRPMLSDLRESGSIEQDANSIVFLSCTDPENRDTSDILVDIAKNRDGAIGCSVFSFDRTTQTMRETDKRYEPPKAKNNKGSYDY